MGALPQAREETAPVFVHSKEDWKSGAFAKVPGDEAEFIPLPDTMRVPANHQRGCVHLCRYLYIPLKMRRNVMRCRR